MNENVSALVVRLNSFLSEEVSLHIVSYEFYQLKQFLKQAKVSFEIFPTFEYYLDDELTFTRNKYQQALSEGDFEVAAQFRKKEKYLLKSKAGTAAVTLQAQPSRFEISNAVITAHLGKSKRDRLLKNLIHSYEL
jgi:hypothetical protein